LGDAVLPEIQQAMELQSATMLAGDGLDEKSHSALTVPIALRGEIIGALGIHDDDDARQWTEDEIALVNAIAERMALAAENLRLLDETQRHTAEERLIGEVTARMRETLDVDTVLQTAIREMGKALGITRVEVRMGGGGRPEDGHE
jgi:transcriptional regulator with GAF, ATPase, and Fis domain